MIFAFICAVGEGSNDSDSSGGTIGVVVGAIVGIALLIIIIIAVIMLYWFCYRKEKGKSCCTCIMDFCCFVKIDSISYLYLLLYNLTLYVVLHVHA